MGNTFVYPCSIKFHASGFNGLLESIFPAKSCWVAWRSGSLLERVRWTWQMKQNSVTQFIQLLKCWLCDVWSDFVLKKDWFLSVDQSWLQSLPISVHLIDLLSITLSCNSFAGIHHSGSAGSNNQTGVQVWLREVRWSFFSAPPLSWLLLVAVYNPFFVALHNLIEKWFIVAENKRRQHFKTMILFCFVFWSAHKTTIYWAFSPFQFASNANWL